MEQPLSSVEQTPGISLYGASVEYGLHCLVWLIEPRETPASSRELAEMQGVSPSLLARILPRLEKAGIVSASGGIAGGYRLARPAEAISVLDVVVAIEGDRRLFDCKEVRRNCALFGGNPPAWSAGGTCGIHAVMLRAEKAMRAELARTSLLDLARTVHFPEEFTARVGQWFDERAATRERKRRTAVSASNRRRAEA